MKHCTVMTVYLTGRDDPQHKSDPRPQRWTPDSDEVVKTWIESLENLGLDGVIFHDGLSLEFTKRHESECVYFMGPLQWETPWTAAEERVRIYRDFIQQWTYQDWFLTTDLSDVEFYKNPFDLMTDPTRLYIGSEPDRIGGSILETWMQRTYGEITDREKPILNPGIVGGSREMVLQFLNRWMLEMRMAIKPTIPPHDIVAFNRLIYREHIPFVTGFPLHTVFRKNEPASCGAAIRHK